METATVLDDHAVRIREELRRRRPRSEEADARACRVVPSGTVSRARIIAPFPFFAARGEGSRIHDIDGNTYIDCAMGEAIREGIRAVAADERCAVTVVGDGSLFITRFVTREVRSHRDLAGENSAAYRELFLYLIRHGVFVPNTHFGLISGDHTDDDVRLIVEAHQRAFRDLRVAGLVPCGS